MDYLFETPTDICLKLAKEMVRTRKRKKITQKQLAARSNVAYASLRKFEKTGRISLESFVKLCMELGVDEDLKSIFSNAAYASIEEVLNDH